MSKTVRTERRQRGIFGWFSLIVFYGFNLFMAIVMWGGLSRLSDTAATATTEAERAGTAIGAALGAGFVLFVWLAGAIILGLCAWFSAGRKIIVDTTRN